MPIPVNAKVVEFLNALAIPTKVPVEPVPTRTVAIPIKLSLILATYKY